MTSVSQKKKKNKRKISEKNRMFQNNWEEYFLDKFLILGLIPTSA